MSDPFTETEDSAVVDLLKPVEAHGETITRLVLRRPTGKDMRLCGNLFIFSGDGGDSTINNAAVAKYITRLGDVPPSVVDALDGVDFMAAGLKISLFLRRLGSSVRTPPTT